MHSIPVGIESCRNPAVFEKTRTAKAGLRRSVVVMAVSIGWIIAVFWRVREWAV